MKFHKITDGYVAQVFDENGKCVSQQFTVADQVNYEDEQGKHILPKDVFHTFDMVQPGSLSLTSEDVTKTKDKIQHDVDNILDGLDEVYVDRVCDAIGEWMDLLVADKT